MQLVRYAEGGVAAQPTHVDLLTMAGVSVDDLTAAGEKEHDTPGSVEVAVV
jgi:hypothetical protein